MNRRKNIFLYSLALSLTLAASLFAQDEKFTDPNVDYSFDLPDAKWKMTAKPSSTSPNVEYVFGERSLGHLEVRKIVATKETMLTDVIHDEEQKLQFRPGYVAGKEENFLGRIRGEIFNFEYVASGRNMAGRFYFLRANDTTIYLLRFTGTKDSLRAIRNQTDSIARTFAVRSSS